MKKYITLFTLGVTIAVCPAGEAVKFDDQKPIREMLVLVRKEAGKGEKKVVKFTSGEFHLIAPAGKRNQKEALVATKPLKAKLTDKKLAEMINDWCEKNQFGEKNQLKWVNLSLDTDAKSIQAETITYACR